MEGNVWVALGVIVGILVPVISAIVWLAYRLGSGDNRIARNERDISSNRDRAEKSIQSLSSQMDSGFEKVFNKIDNLPCYGPGWKKEDC